MKIRILNVLGAVFSILLFALALSVIHRELKGYHVHDILYEMREIPAVRLVLAVLLAILNYIVMTGYDVLAFGFINRPKPLYRRIVAASFISYAFSNNLGLIMLSGAPVRYRLYSAWGLSIAEIASVIVFCVISLWIGFLTVGGFVFLLEPLRISSVITTRSVSIHAVGILFLAVVSGYLMLSMFRKEPIRIGKWEVPVIPLRLALPQIILSSLDWVVLAGILYVLLPSTTEIGFISFLGIFLLAQISGIMSNVPGGLGVFETVIILFLSEHIQVSAIMGPLLAYRGIYYILPLIFSALLLGMYEIKRLKEGVIKAAVEEIGYWIAVLTPHVLAYSIFVSGAILLFSGSIPIVHNRLEFLRDFLPLPIIETSHFLGSLVGSGLILLSRSLHRRVDAACVFTLVLLVAGVVFSLFRGFDYVEALILAVNFAALFMSRKNFYRKASIINQGFTMGWILAVIIVLAGIFWLGFFSYRHIEYSNDLWWRFAFNGDVSRFLRAAVGTTVIFVLFSAAKLLRPYKPKSGQPSHEEIEKVKSVVRNSPLTYANLALLRDKSLLFNKKESAFIMYGVEGRSWVAMGDPVGSEEDREELIWSFRELSDYYDGWTVFYEVSADNLALYVDIGLTLIKLGEEGRVLLNTFSLEGGSRKELRRTLRKLEQEGYSFEIIPSEGVLPLLPELRKISDSWLKEKHTSEKGFSLGFFNEAYLKLFPVAVVKKGSNIVAFANVWESAGKQELSIDLMRYLIDGRHGIMDYLFINLMFWGKQEGYRWFSLGMAPLSGLQDHALAPLWNRIGCFLYRHGEHFYNFQGLRFYKDKFDPEWRPKYLASPGGLRLPRILANIGSLASRGLKGVIMK
jgi:phosphatidylglycerol lysyltransferase